MGKKKNEEQTERCLHIDAKGMCGNFESNLAGVKCSHCEDFITKGLDPRRCGQCGHRDPTGDFCFHVSSPRKEDDPACIGFKLRDVVKAPWPALAKSKAKAAPEQTKHARYVETKLIPLELLDKHPDAEAFGADVEDRVAMSSSVNEIGMLDPISVMQADERYLILDGCGRYDTLKASGATTAMCLVLELDGLTPREFAMHRNTMGRKVTTGQRLMCYLSLNESSILSTVSRETVADGTGRAQRTVSRETAFIPVEISKRLGISRNDVIAGIDLLKTRAEAANNDGDVLATGEVYSAVMDGRLPIRRWKPALLGKVKTKGVAKAQTNYVTLMSKLTISLGTVFGNWHDIEGAKRDGLIREFCKVMMELPPDFHRSFQAVVEEHYPELFKKKGSAK